MTDPDNLNYMIDQQEVSMKINFGNMDLIIQNQLMNASTQIINKAELIVLMVQYKHFMIDFNKDQNKDQFIVKALIIFNIQFGSYRMARIINFVCCFDMDANFKITMMSLNVVNMNYSQRMINFQISTCYSYRMII